MVEQRTGSALWRSGLEQSRLEADGLRLEEITGRRLLGVRGHAPPGWPQAVGALASDAAGTVLCLRPGDWLLVDARAATVPGACWCLDRSCALATLRLSGPAAPWLLAQLCALDVDAMASGPGGQCAQARVGVARVVLHRHPAVGAAGCCWDLLVESSLARDLWERLVAAVPQALALAARFSPGETPG